MTRKTGLFALLPAKLSASTLAASAQSGEPPCDVDDWQLLQTVATDISALDTLFVRHKDYVFRLAWGFTGSRSLAEDVTQDVFLRLAKHQRWRRLAQFRTWLYQVTLNTAREYSRKYTPLAAESSDLTALPNALDDATQDSARQIQLDELAQALSQLPERQRAVVLLRLYEGLSTAETAQVLRCRQGTVKTHLHRAIAKLRGQLLPLHY